MAHITFPDGRTITLRSMTVNDELAVDELGTAGSDLEATDDPEAAQTAYKRYVALLRQTKAILVDATEATSWGGDVGDLTRDDMLGVISQWRQASEDSAVPPE